MSRLGQEVATIAFCEHELADGDVVRDWRHCASSGSGFEDHGGDSMSSVGRWNGQKLK